MTDLDFQTVIKTMAGLWPKQVGELTDEQANVWRTLFDPHPWERCQSALRDMAMSTKFFPRPCEVKARLEAIRERQEGSKAPPIANEPPWETQRRRWSEQDPDRAAEIRSWSNAEAEERYQYELFHRSAEVYGPVAVSTVGRWQIWQRSHQKLGYRATDVVTPHYSEAAKRQYVADGGCADAQAHVATSVTPINRN